MNNENQNVTAALSYSRRALRVFPVHTATDGRCSCGDPKCDRIAKHPRTQHGLNDATTDESTIRRWWTQWPDANIGIATGADSGIVVLDDDPRHGGDALLERLQREHGDLPITVTSMTGGNDGGRHFFFAHPGVRIGNKIGGKGGWPMGFDVRGDGGYIVAPPSVHASGRRYQWQPERGLGEVPFAAPPQWLLQMLTTLPGDGTAGASGVVSPQKDTSGDHERLMEAATHYVAAVPGRPVGCRDDSAFRVHPADARATVSSCTRGG